MVTAASVSALATDDITGSGTEADPYIVYTGAGLAYFSYYTRYVGSIPGGTYIQLGADIDLSDYIWVPIGGYMEDGSTETYFMGNFDGCNYTITGLYIDEAADKTSGATNKRGLFGAIGYDVDDNDEVVPAVIKNLNITDAYVGGYGYLGGVVGYAVGSFEVDYVTFSGTVYSLSTGYVGGIVAYVTTLFSGDTYTHTRSITNCTMSGTIISATAGYVGGIAGYISVDTTYTKTTTISNCTNNASVNSGSSYVGGITGYIYYAGQVLIDYCENNGVVTGYDYVGGVVGYLYISSAGNYVFRNCASNASGSVTANLYAGGMIGYLWNASTPSYFFILSCINYSAITSTNSGGAAGGVIGSFYGAAANCYGYFYLYDSANCGDITAYTYAGGLVGRSSAYAYRSSSSSTIGNGPTYVVNCYNSGDISSTAGYAAGVVSYAYGCSTYQSTYYAYAGTHFYIYNFYNIGAADYGIGYYLNYVYRYNAYYVQTATYGTVAAANGYNSGTVLELATLMLDESNYTAAKTFATYELDTNSTTGNAFWSIDWRIGTRWTMSADVNDGYPVPNRVKNSGYYDYWTDDDNYSTPSSEITSLASFLEGAGTSSSPYLITSEDDLASLSLYCSSNTVDSDTYFELTADLDMSAHKWTPIGSSSYAFSGIFDGGGHQITGLIIDQYMTSYAGLFAYANGATIKNLTIDNCFVGAGQYAGALVGYGSSVTISHCLVKNSSVGSTSQYTGGLVGYLAGGTLSNCVFQGQAANCTGYLGGMVGYASSTAEITSCFVMDSDISTAYNYAGGIIGYTKYQLTLTSCAVEADLYGGIGIGGLVGSFYTTSYYYTISSCTVNGDITSYSTSSSAYVAGLVGQSYCKTTSKISSCYYIGDITLLSLSSSSYVSAIRADYSSSYTPTVSSTYTYASLVFTSSTTTAHNIYISSSESSSTSFSNFTYSENVNGGFPVPSNSWIGGIGSGSGEVYAYLESLGFVAA